MPWKTSPYRAVEQASIPSRIVQCSRSAPFNMQGGSRISRNTVVILHRSHRELQTATRPYVILCNQLVVDTKHRPKFSSKIGPMLANRRLGRPVSLILTANVLRGSSHPLYMFGHLPVPTVSPTHCKGIDGLDIEHHGRILVVEARGLVSLPVRLLAVL